MRALAFVAALALVPAAAMATPEEDTAAVAALDRQWHELGSLSDIENMLADDFRRPMPGGHVWSREDQLAFLRRLGAAPPGMTTRLEGNEIRLFGPVAVATGQAVLLTPQGAEADRTIYTNVYVKRDRWLLVSAHRSSVTRPAPAARP